MPSGTAPELCPVRRPGEPQTSEGLSEPATLQKAKKKCRSVDAVALRVSKEQAKFAGASVGDGSGHRPSFFYQNYFPYCRRSGKKSQFSFLWKIGIIWRQQNRD